MHKIGLLAWITFKDSIRNKALHGILFCGIVLFAVNIIVTGMFTWEMGKVAVDMGLSIVSFSGLILIFFFSINVMSNDIDRKTIYLILSRPIGKPQYIMGKYAGLAMIIILSSIILGLCSAGSVWVSILGTKTFLPPNFSWSLFFLSIGFLTLSLLVMMALTLLWVSITSHSFTALILSMMTYFIGQNMENVKNIISSTKFLSPDSLSVKTIHAVSWVVPNLAVFDLKTTAAYGLSVDAASLLWTALYGISYIGISLIITIFVFQKRELS